MIYKTCFIAIWKKEVMLQHPVFSHDYISEIIFSLIFTVTHSHLQSPAGIGSSGTGETSRWPGRKQTHHSLLVHQIIRTLIYNLCQVVLKFQKSNFYSDKYYKYSTLGA